MICMEENNDAFSIIPGLKIFTGTNDQYCIRDLYGSLLTSIKSSKNIIDVCAIEKGTNFLPGHIQLENVNIWHNRFSDRNWENGCVSFSQRSIARMYEVLYIQDISSSKILKSSIEAAMSGISVYAIVQSKDILSALTSLIDLSSDNDHDYFYEFISSINFMSAANENPDESSNLFFSNRIKTELMSIGNSNLPVLKEYIENLNYEK